MSDSRLYPPLSKDPSWKPDSILVIEVRQALEFMVNLHIRFIGGDKVVEVRSGLFPDWPTTLTLPFQLMSGNTLFLERTPGCFKTKVTGSNLLLEELERIEVDCGPSAREHVNVSRLEVVEPEDPPAEYAMPERPLVDSLHQWTQRSWPGKASSLEDIHRSLSKELKQQDPPPPKGFSRYGGWKDRNFGAEGFFRTHHDGRRWWLVDPDGFPFWSMGVDCVRTGTACAIEGIESVFDPPLPSPQEEPELYTKRKNRVLFHPVGHTLKRLFGNGWREDWIRLTRNRLRRWGFNTLGNWSDPEFIRESGMPYVLPLQNFPTTREKLFRDFPDVFSEEYSENSHRFATQLHEMKDDPLLLGYFMTNEPQWAFEKKFDLGAHLLLSSGDTATLQAMIGFLQEKYHHVQSLNRAWQSDFDSFEDLRKSWDTRRFPGSEEDTLAFTQQAVERFVRIPALACKEIDPNHLNLGTRWAYIHSDYQLAGSDVLDAFSINSYQPCPDPEEVAALVEKTGLPLMIGEFHMGCLNRGLPSGGVRNVRTMRESVEAYRYYMENAAALPGLIGAHYFQLVDQHIMGRFDGENMQIGLVDITSRPYPEWEQICREVHPALYEVVDGQRKPDQQAPDMIPEGTLGW